MESESVRIRVRLDQDSRVTAEANAGYYGLSLGEYLRVVLSTPAPADMQVSELMENVRKRLREASRK